MKTSCGSCRVCGTAVCALNQVKALEMSLIGPECFDFKFYKDKNPDLPPFPAPALWEHFVVNGQFEVCTLTVCFPAHRR